MKVLANTLLVIFVASLIVVIREVFNTIASNDITIYYSMPVKIDASFSPFAMNNYRVKLDSNTVETINQTTSLMQDGAVVKNIETDTSRISRITVFEGNGYITYTAFHGLNNAIEVMIIGNTGKGRVRMFVISSGREFDLVSSEAEITAQ